MASSDFFDGEDSVRKNSKLAILTILIFLVFIIYAFTLFFLQIIQGQQYRNRSQQNSATVSTIPAQRGEIFDRNADQPLVINTDSFAVDLIPGEIPSGYYDTVALKLSEFLGVSKEYIDEKVPPARRRKYTSIEIRTNVLIIQFCKSFLFLYVYGKEGKG